MIYLRFVIKVKNSDTYFLDSVHQRKTSIYKSDTFNETVLAEYEAIDFKSYRVGLVPL